MQHLGAHFLGHGFTQQMVETASAHAGVADRLAGFGALDHLGHHLLRVVRREMLAGHNRHGRQGHALDQAKVFSLVLHSLHGQRGQDQFIGRALEQVMAVCGCVQHFLSSNSTACATQVFDDDRLFEFGGQRHVDLAGNQVRQTTCRIRHHQGHGSVGKILRLNRCADSHGHAHQQAQGFEQFHAGLHRQKRWRDARPEERQLKDCKFFS